MYSQVAILAPLNFVDKARSILPNYNFKHFDGWLAHEQRLPFEQGRCQYQKWQTTDIIFLQVEADYSPINIKVKNNIGVTVISQQMSLVATVAGKYYYEDQIAMDDPAITNDSSQYFKVELHFGDPVQVVLESETLWVKESHPETLLIKYSNAFNNTILWETGIYMMIRVDGTIAEFTPGSTRTTYIDQPANAQTVKGVAYRTFKLIIGNYGGIPNWMIDKLEEIFNQTDVEIDGKGFAAIEGAKFAPKRIERYAWVSWEMEIRETVNRRAKRFDATGLLEKKVAVTYVVDTKLFGPTLAGSANDNTATINEFE